MNRIDEVSQLQNFETSSQVSSLHDENICNTSLKQTASNNTVNPTVNSDVMPTNLFNSRSLRLLPTNMVSNCLHHL